MPKIEEWATQQLKTVLSFSWRLIQSEWKPTHIVQAVDHAHRTSDVELIRTLRTLIGYYLDVSNGAPQKARDSMYENTIVPLYKNLELKRIDPVLFGNIFCIVLSQGHTSQAWTYLTRDDRAKLLAAQAYLTPLPLSLGWVYAPSELVSAVDQSKYPPCFDGCADRFAQVIFERTFTAAYRMQISKKVPLKGVSALCKLPSRRREISQMLETLVWTCEDVCGSLILDALDAKIDSIFEELSGSYHDRID